MIQAVIFNLDGVLVNTDECHYLAWKQMAREQGLPFDDKINGTLQGMRRMDSLRVLLRKAERRYSIGEMYALAARKNDIFNDMLLSLGQENICPGAVETVKTLRSMGIKTAVGSCSENAPGILRQMKMYDLFDTVVDGGQIRKGKPDPEVFLLAAEQLQVPPDNCLVVEDGRAGAEAARRCRMQLLAIGDSLHDFNADYWADNLKKADLPGLIERDYIRSRETETITEE